jgi:hypothetical protein
MWTKEGIALSKLEFFSLALRKIALSLKSVFPILSSYLLIRSHSMFMLALVITIVIVDTLFRPHLTIMSSTIYEVTKVNEEEISSEKEVIRRRMIRTEEKSIRRR